MAVKRGYKQTEVGVIPEDWDVKEFEQIGKVIDGDRGINYPIDTDFSDDGYCLFLSAKNVTKAGFKFSECVFISKQRDDLLNKGKLRRWDVVLTTRGTVGNFAFFDETVPFDNIRINSGMVILRNEKSYIDSGYLYATLNSQAVCNQIERVMFGSAQPQLTVKVINKFQIPIPPIAEQQAIAEALSDVDGLISALDALIAKQRAIKHGAMQELLTGQRRLPGFAGEWKTYKFGDVFQFLNSANNSRSDLSDYGEVKYIHYGDIHTNPNSFLDCASDSLPLISKDKVVTIPYLEDGDLIMADASEDYTGTGKSVEIKNATGMKVVAGLHTLVLRGDKNVLADGFKGYLQQMPFVKTSLIRIATGISVYGISKSNVKNIEVCLPSVPEQTAIAQILADMDDAIAALVQKRAKTVALKQGMMQALLTGQVRLV
jgi:type I restriction enzyme S subunit